MANIDDAFRIERLSLDDNTLIASGDSQPNIGPGYEAPQGSLYLRSNNGTDGELYVKFGPADVDWQLAGTGGSTPATGDLAGVVCSFSTNIPIPLTYTNVLFDVVHLQNDSTVIEHDPVNIDRILIKETGLYFMNFSISFDSDPGEEAISGRFVINDTTEVPGSLRLATEDDEINDLSNAIVAELNAGDYVTFQHLASDPGNVLTNTSNIAIIRASGTKGDIGPAGSGSTINILDEGISVPNSPHSEINFIGDYVSATDAGSGRTDVTISNPVFGTEYQYAESLGVTTTTSTAFLNKLTFTTTSLPAGTYRVAIRYGWNHNSAGNDFEGRFREDGVNVGQKHKQEPKDSAGSFSTTGTSQRYFFNKVSIRTLSAGTHTYTFDFRTDNNGTASSVWDVTIELWRIS